MSYIINVYDESTGSYVGIPALKGKQGPKGDTGNAGVYYGTTAPTDESIKVWINPNGVADCPYRIGQIYISSDSTSPASIYANTTWERIKDQFILAAGDIYEAGSEGGEAEHTLTVDEMPSHNHILPGYSSVKNGVVGGTGEYRLSGDTGWTFNHMDNAGGDQPHNNMPPYKTYYMWERTA